MEGPGISKSARDAQEAARTGHTYHCGVGDIEARPLKPCGKGERLLSDLGLRLVGLEWTLCNLLVGLTCGSTAAPPTEILESLVPVVSVRTNCPTVDWATHRKRNDAIRRDTSRPTISERTAGMSGPPTVLRHWLCLPELEIFCCRVIAWWGRLLQRVDPVDDGLLPLRVCAWHGMGDGRGEG